MVENVLWDWSWVEFYLSTCSSTVCYVQDLCVAIILLMVRRLSRGYTSDFLLTPVMRLFQILSRSQRAMKIASVATLGTGEARAKKIAGKKREKLNELNFSRFLNLEKSHQSGSKKSLV